MSRIFQLPNQVPVVAGAVSPGCKANFYLTGTTTNTNTYTDAALTTPSSNPVVADAAGVFSTIYLDPDIVYKLTLNDSTDSLIYTEDPIQDSLTQANIGKIFYPIISGGDEETAGLTDDDITHNFFYGDVRRYKAQLNNSTDDATAFSNAAKSNTDVYVPPVGTARIATAIVVTTPIHMYGGGTIRPDLGAGGGKLFAFETNDVLVENLIFDGTTSTGTLAFNTYILFGGDGSTKFYRHSYRNLHIKDVFLSDGLAMASNLLVTHAIYVDNVDRVTIEDNHFNTVSGAGVFTRDITGLTVHGNRFIDCQWYNCTLDSDVKQFSIRNNYFDCQLATGVYYGGMVNLMSLHTAGRNSDGVVDNNYFTGNVSYGVVIRCLSITGLQVSNNVMENWDFGTWALSNDLSGIRTETRGVSTAAQNGPCHDVSIFGNRMTNPDTVEEHRGIYCGNLFQTSRNPSTNISVYDNEIVSASTSLYFSEGIIFHGGDGGFDGVHVYGNDVTVFGQTTPVVGGAVGFVGNDADGGVRNAYVGRNRLTGLGTPSGSQEVGISIGAFTNFIYTDVPSYIDNFFYGVRSLANSGPVIDKLDDQEFVSCTTNLLENVSLSRYGRTLTGSGTWNPGSIATAASETFQINGVTGAVLSDRVEFSFSLDIQDMHLEGAVSASGTIEATLQNNSGGARDLSSGTLYYEVFRRGTG